MLKRSFRKYKSTILFASILQCIVLIQSCSGKGETDSVEVDDLIPKSERDYDYSDSVSVEDEVQDLFISSLQQNFNAKIEGLDSKGVDYRSDWTFIPDRLGSDSTASKLFMIDSNIVFYKSWIYSDSIKTINALYNWFDCFGDDCSGLSVGDSVNVSKRSFILLQDNTELFFLESQRKLDLEQWDKFLSLNKKNTPWNYILQQVPRGTINWLKKPD